MQNVGATWSALGGTDAQGNDFLFDLQPRPSNAAGDVLDGRIDVSDALALPFGSRLNGGGVPTDMTPNDEPASRT